MDVLEGVREILANFDTDHHALPTIPDVKIMQHLFRCFKVMASNEPADDSWAKFDTATMVDQKRCDAMAKVAECLGVVNSCIQILNSSECTVGALDSLQKWSYDVQDKVVAFICGAQEYITQISEKMDNAGLDDAVVKKWKENMATIIAMENRKVLIDGVKDLNIGIKLIDHITCHLQASLSENAEMRELVDSRDKAVKARNRARLQVATIVDREHSCHTIGEFDGQNVM